MGLRAVRGPIRTVISMDDLTLRTLLILRLQPTAEPVLADAEVDALFAVAQVSGLRTALYMGWDAKASKVLADHDMKSGDNELKQSQVYVFCVNQRDSFLTGSDDLGIADPGSNTDTAKIVKRGMKSVNTVRGL